MTGSETGHAAHRAAHRVLAVAIAPSKVMLRVPSFIAGAIVAAETDGIVTLPTNLARRLATLLGLTAFEPPVALPCNEIAQFWHKRYHRDIGHRWLRNLTFELFSGDGGWGGNTRLRNSRPQACSSRLPKVEISRVKQCAIFGEKYWQTRSFHGIPAFRQGAPPHRHGQRAPALSIDNAGVRRLFISVLLFGVAYVVPQSSETPRKCEIGIGLAVVAGAALLEAALVPGILLGGAALLAPQLLTGRRSKKRRQRTELPLIDKALSSSRDIATRRSQPVAKRPLGRAITKTITFRAVATTLDFTTSYIVIGELASAAGLPTFNLIAGPLFYFGHEATWNYLRPSNTSVTLHLPALGDGGDARGLTISPALAKTITYRTIATIVDFTANYVVVGTVAEATIPSATSFFLGPFVYFGHEKAWEDLAGDFEVKAAPAKAIDLLPAAA